MRLYVASSWRNTRYPLVVEALRAAGHEVFDFRHPTDGNNGFHWSEIDPEWKSWTPEQYRKQLFHPLATGGFHTDFTGMMWAEACVLVLPCGRSAHLEAGWFAGMGLPVWILLDDGCEPELMYRLAHGHYVDVSELIADLNRKLGEAPPA